MAGEKILIIDPSLDDVRPLIEGLLDPEGYVVAHALDGEEGLRQALHGNPDLIIGEFAAPRRSGLDVLAQLRKSEREIPFILTGVSGSAETFRRALRMGVVDYLLKPLDLGEARAAILRALAKCTAASSTKETGLLSRGFEQINRQLERRLRELSILYGIGKAVASVLDLENLLKRIVEAAVYLTGAEEGFLLLIDEQSNELYMRAGQGLGKKFASGFRVKSGDYLSWQVVETGKPIMINSVEGEEKTKVKTGYLVKALLHVPLKVRSQVIGVLSVDNKLARKTFSDNDLHLLSALADYAAIAIYNARLYEQAEAKARHLSELLTAQETTVSATPIKEAAASGSAPPEWLVEQVETHRRMVEEGLRETQKVAQELTARLATVEQLAQWWHKQQTESDALTWQASGTAPEGITLANLQKMLNNLNEGLLLTDSQGIVRLTNGTAGQIVGSNHLIGQRLTAISASPHWQQSLDRLQAEGALDKGTWMDVTFWDNERLIKASFVPLAGGEKEKGWAVILKDLSQERAAQLGREDLSTAISQELRTPMTVLTSYTDLLLAETMGLLVPVQQRLLQRMRVNLSRMSKTLNNLMTLPHLVREKQQDTFLPVDLNAVLEDALANVGPRLADKKLNISLHIQDKLPKAAAEPDCVYQMITNLLQNAIRATPSGGTIEVRAEAGTGDSLLDPSPHLVLSVRDQGGGIAPEFLGQVFGHFFSDDDQPIPGLGGKGIELLAVKRLVEAFGGRVWVETEPQAGSTFSFVLPTINSQPAG